MGQGAERIYTVLSEASKKGQVFGNPFHSLSFTRELSERKYELKESTHTHTPHRKSPSQENQKNKVPCFCFFGFASLEVAEILLVHKLALGCSWVWTLPSTEHLF